jgi:5-methylcytosine-specific restriction endonuclease McrA
MKTDEQQDTKTCLWCKQVLPRDQFHRRKSTRDGLNSHCKACQSKYAHDRRRADPTTYNSYSANYRATHKQEIAEYQREWRKANPDMALQRQRSYRAAHAESTREYHRKWREEHRESEVERQRLRYETNREEVLNRQSAYKRTERGRQVAHAAWHRRRAREQNAPGDGITTKDIRALATGQTDRKGRVRCWWCSKVITVSDWHLDHRVPISKGGAHDPSNACLTCARCNQTKSARMPAEFSGRLL